jgi:hypothetical protein
MHEEDVIMRGPVKHRLHEYEAGWLTLLLQMQVADERDLVEAQNRVAREAVAEMEARRRRRRERRRRRREEP